MTRAAGNLPVDRRGQAQAVVVLQPEIEQDDVRLGFPHFLQRLVDIGGRRQDLESRLGVDHRRDPLAEQPVVVDEDQRDGGCRRPGHGRAGLARLSARLRHRVIPGVARGNGENCGGALR